MYRRAASTIIRYALGIILVFVLLVGDVRPASAALRCYVKANAGGWNNGSSWANAYTSLQSALGGSPCTEIWVAQGTYKPSSSSDRTISFQLKNGVSIYGGFAGNETLLNQRNPSLNATILSGEYGVFGYSDNAFHVVKGTGTNHSALLDGFTITLGYADGSAAWPSHSGGGVLNYPGSPTLVNLNISTNAAAANGGGMYNNQSSPILINVTFRGNSTTSDHYGGGMENEVGSAPTLINVTFSSNAAMKGGGMSNINSSPILKNVTFYNNLAHSVGGAMYNFSSSPNLTNVTVSSNWADANGGAIFNEDVSNPAIKNSIIYGNFGGQIINDASSPAVSRSIVQGGYPGAGNLNANPLLKPLGSYGGFTQTMPLEIGSPAIDAGTNSGCPPKDQRGRARPQDGNRDGLEICDMGATESEVRLKTYSAVGAQDGWVLESSELSALGGEKNSAQTTIAVGDDAADRQSRGILSFNTASLPASAVMLSAKLKIRQQGPVGTNPFTTHGNLVVDVRKGSFSDNPALQLGDFQSAASKINAMSIPNILVNGWYSKSMPASSLKYISKNSLTQFRLRFSLDDNDDSAADLMKFFSGDYSNTGFRPKLVIQYYVP